MDHITIERALLTARLFWAALLGGQIFLAFAVVKMWHAGVVPAAAPAAARIILLVPIVLFVTLVPLGLFLRNQIYKRSWQGPAIAPQGYLTGNLVLLALCETVVLSSLIASLLLHAFWPAIGPGLLAVAMQALNFPNGRAMEASPDTEGTSWNRPPSK